MQVTGQQERTPRPYRKRNANYWLDEIRESRRKRRKESLPIFALDSGNAALKSRNVEDLSVTEIKEKLKQLGVVTRVRKLEKLQEILQVALQNAQEQVV